MKLAYLINQYPGISHSFIRREIQALERQGAEIVRYAIRKSAHGIISDEDRAEETRTAYIVGAGAGALAGAVLSAIIRRPAASVAAIFQALKIGARSEAGLVRHVFYAAEALVLANWMARDGVAHVHAHFGTNSATVAMLAAKAGGGSFSLTVHGPEEFDKPALISLPDKIRAAAFTAGVSSFGMSQLRRLVEPEFWGKIKIVPCGVEPEFYTGETPAAPETARFVCVGRLCEQKGQLTLIEAAGEVKRRGRDFHLVLVGDGDMRADIEAAIIRHDLEDEVTLAGWKTPGQVRDELVAARAFVLPSYAEGLPVSIMEAMTLQRPVISTYIAGIPELVIDGENGWLAPAGDTCALADALVAAIDAPAEKIAAMGALGKQRALARHDIDAVAARLLSLFAEAQS
ncbi:MAG: glycosyltransferase family 4 protein [Parvularculaceae bacterium]|nr:glycosyltransferase family 4 protein [Parvularculaceae bacterium]